jgi:hypothetical protein
VKSVVLKVILSDSFLIFTFLVTMYFKVCQKFSNALQLPLNNCTGSVNALYSACVEYNLPVVLHILYKIFRELVL